MGGTYYSEIENERLLALYNINKDKPYSEIADMAVYFGICPGRSARGVAQQISKLVNPPITEIDDQEYDMEVLILRKENNELKEKLSSLLEETILGTATLYNGYALHIEYKEILKWLFKHEPEKTAARIEALKLEIGGNA